MRRRARGVAHESFVHRRAHEREGVRAVQLDARGGEVEVRFGGRRGEGGDAGEVVGGGRREWVGGVGRGRVEVPPVVENVVRVCEERWQGEP